MIKLQKCLYKCFLVTLLLLGSNLIVRAAAPMVKTQVPGYYRMMLGQFEVTALNGGLNQIDVKLLHNAPEARIQELLKRQFVPTPKMPTSVNAFLVNTGSKLLLIDSGTSKPGSPMPGGVLQNLKASGYTPDQVDIVLITHMHGDHTGGLLDSNGKPAFPNATIWTAKAESDYWLSTDIAAKSPADAQSRFKMARDISSPYKAAGKWETFENGFEPVPGIKAVETPGHTPGHTVYEITSDGQTLVAIGDTVHSVAVQFAVPTVSCDFDKDQPEAIASRLALFKNISARNTIVAGAHLPFPGIGRLHVDGEDTYTWVPIVYTPL